MTADTKAIRDSTSGNIPLAWTFAIFWNLFMGLAIWLVHQQRIELGARVVLYSLLGAGLVLLSIAVYLTLIEIRFGRSVFELQTRLSVPGGVVTGVIRIPRPFTCQDGIHLRLACYRGAIQRLAGNKKVQVDSVVWEELCTLDRISQMAVVSHIPVCFRIPNTAKPSDNSKIGDQLLWRLEANAKTGGVHYAASFLIPVFAGQIPPEIHSFNDPTASLRSPEPARRQFVDHHIHLTALSGGGCQCELAPGRNVTMTMILAMMGMSFLGGGLFFLSHLAGRDNVAEAIFLVAGVLFGACSTAVGAFLVVCSLATVLNRVTITVRHGMITIKNTMAGIGRQKELSAADIKDIVIETDGAINNRVTYCVKATLSEAKPVNLCGLIGDKRDAQRLAMEFKRELLAPSHASSILVSVDP